MKSHEVDNSWRIIPGPHSEHFRFIHSLGCHEVIHERLEEKVKGIIENLRRSTDRTLGPFVSKVFSFRAWFGSSFVWSIIGRNGVSTQTQRTRYHRDLVFAKIKQFKCLYSTYMFELTALIWSAQCSWHISGMNKPLLALIINQLIILETKEIGSLVHARHFAFI